MKPIEIDLHGLRHCEAERFLIRKIEELWDTETQVHIITGHSPRMKEIAINILKEYKLEYEEGEPPNTGYLRTEI